MKEERRSKKCECIRPYYWIYWYMEVTMFSQILKFDFEKK